jgi:hypothetical protein
LMENVFEVDVGVFGDTVHVKFPIRLARSGW